MKPGDLRRFRHNAFHVSEKHRNGRLFLIMPWTQQHNITILMDGKLDPGWSYRVLEDNSEAVDETG
jgi:hypothetical protein